MSCTALVICTLISASNQWSVVEGVFNDNLIFDGCSLLHTVAEIKNKC